MKKILLPIDFSENTWSVCKYATLLAKDEITEIRLFHSYFDQVIVTDSSFPTGVDTDTMINEQLLRDIKERAKNDILELQKKLIDYLKEIGKKDIKVVYSVEGGEAEYEILDACEEYKPDIIVMGTSGNGDKGFLEGSVSKRIMNNTNIPVFAIPNLKTFPHIGNVLYTSDINSDDIKTLESTLALLKPFNIKIFYLHILIGSRMSEAEKELKPIKEHFKELEREGVLDFYIKEKTDIQDDIEEFIQKNDISLITFIPHKRNIFKRIFTHTVTKKDLLETNIPLLSIRHS